MIFYKVKVKLKVFLWRQLSEQLNKLQSIKATTTERQLERQHIRHSFVYCYISTTREQASDVCSKKHHSRAGQEPRGGLA